VAGPTGREDADRRLPAAPIDGRTLLQLGRDSSQEALDRLREHSPEELAGALLELVPARRAEVLELAERVDEIVPLLPEAEFTTTVREAGIEEYGWLVEFASPEQRIAAVDLDCWRDFHFSPSRLLEWLDAMIAAGPEVLAASFDELDPELWVLALKTMGDFAGPEAAGSDLSTDDGLVFYSAHSAEDEERIRAILGTALVYSPSHYWWLVQSALYGSTEESVQLAGRWQRGRLADLGFPEREQAMGAYKPLRVEDVPVADAGPDPSRGALTETNPPIPALFAGSLLARALAELSGERVDEVMGEVMALANSLAVADQQPLAERETVEKSVAKALRGIDRGLAEVSRARSRSLAAVLDATRPLDLFRLGASLDPTLQPHKTLAQLEREAEPDSDWNEIREMISEADMTVGYDGRLK
jgi:hypothetical protein